MKQDVREMVAEAEVKQKCAETRGDEATDRENTRTCVT